MTDAQPNHTPAAQALITAFAGDTFESWDPPEAESIRTGRGRIAGIDAVLLVSDFGFVGGSIGEVAARRLIDAINRATDLGLPVVAAPASGGTRMQEGTPAFVRMVTVVDAVARHKAAGLPYVVYLRHPTTGGTLASWASLGHVTLAEPSALIGLLGPRVVHAVIGSALPTAVQTAEHLAEVGIVDAVVPLDSARAALRSVLSLLRAGDEASPGPIAADPPEPQWPSESAWESVQRTRSPDRPGIQELLRACSDETFPLAGSGAGDTDSGLLLALARLEGRNCVVVGHDRTSANGGVIGPAALRMARRGIQLADELGLPLVTVVDTPGAELSVAAEQGGLAGEIARTLADLRNMRAPSVAILLEQGCGGVALALLGTRRIVAAEHGWLSPLPFDGASAIVFRDADHAAEMAERLRIRAVDLQRDGVVDSVVPEPPADTAPSTQFLRQIGHEALRQIGTQRAV